MTKQLKTGMVRETCGICHPCGNFMFPSSCAFGKHWVTL